MHWIAGQLFSIASYFLYVFAPIKPYKLSAKLQWELTGVEKMSFVRDSLSVQHRMGSWYHSWACAWQLWLQIQGWRQIILPVQLNKSLIKLDILLFFFFFFSSWYVMFLVGCLCHGDGKPSVIYYSTNTHTFHSLQGYLQLFFTSL